MTFTGSQFDLGCFLLNKAARPHYKSCPFSVFLADFISFVLCHASTASAPLTVLLFTLPEWDLIVTIICLYFNLPG